MNLMKCWLPAVILLLLSGCSSPWYSEEDYSTTKKIDAHLHLRVEESRLLEMAQEHNFMLVTVNVESDKPASQEAFTLSLWKRFPDRLIYLGYFPTDSINRKGWAEETLGVIDRNLQQGARGIKIWKNIGMVIRDEQGRFIMADDPVFDPVFAYMAEKRIPLMSHLGEPKECWQPLEKMVFSRGYYKNHPQYHMYNNPECPGYEMQIAAMERLLEKNPDLIYIGAHLASLEWSVDEVSSRLDRYPNMYVDLSARMGYLQLQARDDREKVRNFFISYHNRILYGTDFVETPGKDDSFYNWCHETWINDWNFLVTDNKFEKEAFSGTFKGLRLPKDVVDDIYYNNAYNLLINNNLKK